MISLSGPTRAQSGSTYCVDAANVGNNLAVKAYVGGVAVGVTITQDTTKHTASICLIIPKGATGGIEVLAADSSNIDYVSHSALISR